MNLKWDQFEIRGIEADIDINNLARMTHGLFPSAVSLRLEKLPHPIIHWLDLTPYKRPSYFYHESDSRNQKVYLQREDILRVHYAVYEEV